MHGFTRTFLFFAAVLAVAISIQAQSPGSAAIGGRVSVSGKPANNVSVTIVGLDSISRSERYRRESDGTMKGPLRLKAVTDAEGRYRFSNLPAGTYRANLELHLTALARAGSSADKVIMIDDGESRDDVNLDYIRGGVITRRVTDANGKPLIAARIMLCVVREIRGVVKITGGLLPENVEIEVFALPSGEDESKRYSGVRYVRTDGRGQFTLDGLLPREHELSVRMIQRLGERGGRLIYERRPEQRVAVSNGAEAEVTINIDYGKIDWEGRQ